MSTLKIKKRFQALQRPHTQEEKANLEAAILEEGRVRDAIIVMQGDVIIDGEHRYGIATKHDIPFDVVVKHFDSDEEAEAWILRNQLARRNLSEHDYKVTLGRYYNAEKKGVGGDRRSESAKSGVQNQPLKTAERIARETGKSADTVKRAGKRAEAYDSLCKAAKTLIDQKPSNASDKAMIALAGKSASEQQQLARQVRTGQKPSFDAALGVNGRGKSKPAEKPSKPPKQYPRSHWLKQWEQAIGPVVRLVDKIAGEVGESKSSHHVAVQDQLEYATQEMTEWLS